ncbi:hypothetical protein GGD89_002306, partial [Roseospira visakhapatnamensis]|nr:hypothetical protein [Roseospira visakhapatnamensis]
MAGSDGDDIENEVGDIPNNPSKGLHLRLIPLSPGPHHVVTGGPESRRTKSEQPPFPE